MRYRGTLTISTTILVAGCVVAPPPAAPDPVCACEPGTVCRLGECVPGSRCGGERFAVPPSVLLSLDRSCSMQGPIGLTSKWELAVGAVDALLVAHDGSLQPGLALFPDLEADACGQAPALVSPAPGTEGEIRDALRRSLAVDDPLYPDGPCVTNTLAAIDQAAAEPALHEPGRAAYLVLVTDGRPARCDSPGGDPDIVAAVGTLRESGVETFVVGFDARADAALLDELARAGGALPGYLAAEDGPELVAALAAVAERALDCRLPLTREPPAPDDLHLFLDGERSLSFVYDAAGQAVVVTGESCDRIRRGEVTDAEVVFGCGVR